MDAFEFAALAQELSRADAPDQTAAQVVAHACTALGATHGGVTLIRSRGRLETIGASDDVVVKADQLQYELGEGPCHDAAWEATTLVSQDLSSDTRWPEWAPRVVQLGIKSAMGAELTAADDGRRLGALNLYWTEPTVFTADDLAYASIFAVHAAVALSASLQDAQLHTALDARKVIGQAEGILMERHDLSADQSFEVLRRYSQDHNIKLREVAQQLVDSRRLPEGGAALSTPIQPVDPAPDAEPVA
ncbi:GAF and ANTAR domain-containing protein [Flexivirga sp.]|uniref:GAF and ANTAR domain-containing protein n=1 Tax=Flexivirga sp. TaxID=1962927 RepID=UPI003F7DAD62